MKGLVENNYRENPVWIKSCENFRSGENPFVQPKYFHESGDVSVAYWYKKAYPKTKDEVLTSYYKFDMFEADVYEGRRRIRVWSESACGNELNCKDNLFFNRLWLELYYKKDYIIDDFWL